MAKRRFTAREGTVRRELEIVMERMQVEKWEKYDKYEDDQYTCIIRFVRNGKEYKFQCSEFEHPSDSFRATQMTITLMWRVREDYRVLSFEEVFAGTRCIESDSILIKKLTDGTWNPFGILGLERDCTKDEVKRAYKTLAKKNHPDTGGSDERMSNLTKARDEILESLN